MSNVRTGIVMIVLGALSLVSWAAEPTSAPTKKVNYEKNTKLDFEEAVVDGQFQSPDAQLVDSDRNVYFDSMIEPKKDFRKELKRSSGAIR